MPDIDYLRSTQKVEEMLHIKVTVEKPGELVIHRTDVEDCSVPQEQPVLPQKPGPKPKPKTPLDPAAPKRPRGRPRKNPPKPEEVAKIQLAVAMWSTSVRSNHKNGDRRQTSKCANSKTGSSTLAGGFEDEEMDWGSDWGKRRGSARGESGEHDDIVEIHYGLVSNEYSERDEPWLFDESKGWLVRSQFPRGVESNHG